MKPQAIKNRSPLAIDAENEREEEEREFPPPDRSKLFYKFRSLDAAGLTLKGLSDRTIWCSHFRRFNDLFEFRFEFDRHPAKTDVVFEQWRRDFPQHAATMSRKMVPIYAIEILKSMLEEFGISCFSRDPLNPLLWSYYADSYRGVSLGFEFPAAGDNVFTIDSMHQVQYRQSPRRFDVLMLKDRTQIFQKLIPYVTTKHRIWKHEAEWRYVRSEFADKAVTFPSESLKEVVFGPGTPNEARQSIRDICRQNGMSPYFASVEMNSWSYTLGINRAY